MGRAGGGLLTLKLSSLSATIPFALMLLILLVRPSGLMGEGISHGARMTPIQKTLLPLAVAALAALPAVLSPARSTPRSRC